MILLYPSYYSEILFITFLVGLLSSVINTLDMGLNKEQRDKF